MADKIKVFRLEGDIPPDCSYLVCNDLRNLTDNIESEVEPFCEVGDKFGRQFPVNAEVGMTWTFKVTVVEMTQEELDAIEEL